MKYHQYSAGNDKETEYGEHENSMSASPEVSKKGDGKAIKAIKLGCLVVFFGLIIGGVLILLIFAMWAILAIGVGVISGISFTSPLCWVVGGLISLIIVCAVITHKSR
nr:hypothetical protein [uncultured Methanobacterium sp.]